MPLAFRPARRSSSTGARIGRHRGRARPSCRSRTSSSVTAALSSPRLSAADPRNAVRRPQPRLSRAGRRSSPWHLRQHEDGGRPDRSRQGAARSTCASRRWSATTCSRRSSAIRRPAGRRGRSRRTCRMRAIGCGSTHQLPDLEALNDWLETRCGSYGLKRRISAAGHGSRRLGRGGAASDAAPRPFDGFVEHAKRVSPTCLIAFRAQPLQRAGVFRQSTGQRAGLCRAYRRRRRGAASSASTSGSSLAPTSTSTHASSIGGTI